MDEARRERIQRFTEIFDELSVLRAELDVYRDELRALRERGDGASKPELASFRLVIQELVRETADRQIELEGLQRHRSGDSLSDAA